MADPERFSIATRLYVRLRRLGGPPIDPMRMLEDDAYALATVQQLAESATDPEVIHMAARLDAMLHDLHLSNQPVRQTAPLPEAAAAKPKRYVGALR
jgi:hypothetical protein